MTNYHLIKQQFNKNKTSWISSARFGLSVNHDNRNIPWYCYDAINFLQNNLSQNDVVFEYGCGSSTIFYQSRVKKIVALESNKIWFKFIANIMSAQHKNFELTENYFKTYNMEIFLMEDAINQANYENFAKEFSVKHNIKFDFIIIDSLKRYKCAINSIDAIKSNGFIILDDAERDNYKKIFEFFKINSFQEILFEGIAPAQLKIKKTCFFKKVNRF